MVSEEEVKAIAALAHLELSDNQLSAFAKKLESILGYVQELESVSLGSEGLTEHIPKDATSLRPDDVSVFDDLAAIMKNSPQLDQNCFCIPTVVEHR